MQGVLSNSLRKGSGDPQGPAWGHCERVLPNCMHYHAYLGFGDGISALVENVNLMSGFQPHDVAAQKADAGRALIGKEVRLHVECHVPLCASHGCLQEGGPRRSERMSSPGERGCGDGGVENAAAPPPSAPGQQTRVTSSGKPFPMPSDQVWLPGCMFS